MIESSIKQDQSPIQSANILMAYNHICVMWSTLQLLYCYIIGQVPTNPTETKKIISFLTI